MKKHTTAAAQPAPAPEPAAEPAATPEAYLRLAADFENFRRRTRRDAAQQAAAEKEAFILDLLPVLDSLDRACASGADAPPSALQQGVALTWQQLTDLLHRHGVDSFEAVGQPFDPARHEAIATGHDPQQPDQVVLAMTARGYQRGDVVLRPARVVVNEVAAAGESHHGG
jgi:molecular chaperone GrpE